MTRWLLTGASGMLGSDLRAVLAARPDVSLTALDRAGLDVTDETAVTARVPGHGLVINAAAWTNVDEAETAEDAAIAVNGSAVASLARACAAYGARLLHISTDYVFDGTATTPYPEDAPTAPVNAYGRGKLAGERAVLDLLPDHGYIVRTAWLYGEHGRNFVATMLRLATQRDTVAVVADQHGQPTWSYALAGQLVALGEAALRDAAPAGVYHGTATGQTTWYGLARAVFAGAGHDPDRVRPITSEEYAQAHGAAPARRPAYSVLSHDRWALAGLDPLPPWQESLTRALRRPGFAAVVPARS
jgi:dTDP-4-dehydrorhamnose reductase